MGDPTGFMKYERSNPTKLAVAERVKTYSEFENPVAEEELRNQGARCMDCGVPFCHGPMGCPLGNLIPVWNDHVYRGEWEEAIHALHATNNFPEFTGRICPAPCETACVLGINEPAVTIKQMEVSIIDHAFREGWIKPEPPASRSGHSVAVIGSGPAGLAAAQQLNRAGHSVTVFERADRIGGLLMYGIPNFKLSKDVVNRRVKLMEEEGITFKTNANVGVNVDVLDLKKQFDAIVLAGGATLPRDLPIPGRELKGVHFAMEFLPQQNKRLAGDKLPPAEEILATGKHVVVIGGGDTGSDCIGTSLRQGAKSITQLELLPEPPGDRTPDFPWPYWPFTKRVSSSQEEAAVVVGGNTKYAVNTQNLSGDEDGHVRKLHLAHLEWTKPEGGGRPSFKVIEGQDEVLDADLVLLAMGFVSPEHGKMLSDLGVEFDNRGNVATQGDSKMTSAEGVFTCGDMRRGQSLVVWAIAEGRDCAHDVDAFLTKKPSKLPRANPL